LQTCGLAKTDPSDGQPAAPSPAYARAEHPNLDHSDLFGAELGGRA
jgi:hypothetical protein